MKKRFDAVGERGFEDHTLLELLLFYGVPQKDTNPIAHRLIERFCLRYWKRPRGS